MAYDAKSKRLQILPDKIQGLVTLPETKDWVPYRDTNYYPQFISEIYESNKWPDLKYGQYSDDIIKVNIYGDDEIKLPTFARDLPLYWKLKQAAGEEEEVMASSPVKTFVYKSKKKKKGPRIAPGGFR